MSPLDREGMERLGTKKQMRRCLLFILVAAGLIMAIFILFTSQPHLAGEENGAKADRPGGRTHPAKRGATGA